MGLAFSESASLRMTECHFADYAANANSHANTQECQCKNGAALRARRPLCCELFVQSGCPLARTQEAGGAGRISLRLP